MKPAEILELLPQHPQELQILPVSKGHDGDQILKILGREAALQLGENYLEELQQKAADFARRNVAVEWHYLGRLQSRKIAEICAVAACVHTVSRAKELNLLAQQRRVPQFFIQVNISDEDQKNGCTPMDLPELLAALKTLNLESRFRGLMGMASPLEKVGEAGVRAAFAKLRKLRDEHCAGTELNMGMSGDFPLAVSEGSNLLRLGTLLFGERFKKV